MFCNPERQNCLFFSVQFSLRAKTNTGWILGRSLLGPTASILLSIKGVRPVHRTDDVSVLPVCSLRPPKEQLCPHLVRGSRLSEGYALLILRCFGSDQTLL